MQLNKLNWYIHYCLGIHEYIEVLVSALSHHDIPNANWNHLWHGKIILLLPLIFLKYYYNNNNNYCTYTSIISSDQQNHLAIGICIIK